MAFRLRQASRNPETYWMPRLSRVRVRPYACSHMLWTVGGPRRVSRSSPRDLDCCWAQLGTTAAAAMFVIKADPTDVDAVSTTLFAKSLFIRIASFRLLSRNRENTLGMTLSSTATTTMASAKPGVTGLSPALHIYL